LRFVYVEGGIAVRANGRAKHLIGTSKNPIFVAMLRYSQKITPYIFNICRVAIFCSRLHKKQEVFLATMFFGEDPSGLA
jgi:hypothetical protein